MDNIFRIMTAGEWEEFPTYFELHDAVYEYLRKQVKKNEVSNSVSFARIASNVSPFDVTFTILSAVVWTVLRQAVTKKILKPLGRRCALTSKNQAKMPESAWKFIYYLLAWSFNFYILILSGDYNFLAQPSTVWAGWSLDESLPKEIHVFYIVQCGFYLHSMYATIFMDTWKTDSIAMIIHHASTLMLIVFSFVLRCHNIGCLVLFFHDICDIFLEFSKLNVYFKLQRGKEVRVHSWLANGSFLSFTLVWFVARLYWYPLRVIYTGISDINGLQSVLPCSLIMNGGLWLLLVLNIYWSYLITQTLYRVATGQLAEDAREYDVEEQLKLEEAKKLEEAGNRIRAIERTREIPLKPYRRSDRSRRRLS